MEGTVSALLNGVTVGSKDLPKHSCEGVIRHVPKTGAFPEYRIGQVNEIEFTIDASSIPCWCLSPNILLTMGFHYNNVVRK